MEPGQRRQPVPEPRRAEADAGQARDLVVVAVDGSEASVRAIIWALRYAAGAGLRVEALTTWPLHGPVFVREVTGHFCEPRWRAREVQAQAFSRALAAVDDAPPYDLRVVNASVVDALARAGTRAVLVVAGSDGPGVVGTARSRLTARLREVLGDLLVVVGPDGPYDAGAEDQDAERRLAQGPAAGGPAASPPPR